jgi:tetratricopeptide (TPR) repeat protein
MWPTPQDYNEAVQNPGLSFSDDMLRDCSPETNAFGLPKPCSGSFASVYHLTSGPREWAVRCFLHNFAHYNLEERYNQIGRCLQNSKLPHAVDFQYLREGIRVKNRWFPILKMQWVAGETLNKWVETQLHDAESLEKLRDRFAQLCIQLSKCGIAHGDLQHGNILVVNGQLKLVDYDDMYVPQLENMGSNELGHRHYQHPARSRNHYADHLDRFSAWSIYTSLYCLSRDWRLWHRLEAGDECLLFKDTDYRNPMESAAFRMLEHHEFADVRRTARNLRRLLDLPLESLPALGEPVEGVEALADLSAPATMPSWFILDANGAPLPVPGEERATKQEQKQKEGSLTAGELLSNLANAAAPSIGSSISNSGQVSTAPLLTTQLTTGSSPELSVFLPAVTTPTFGMTPPPRPMGGNNSAISTTPPPQEGWWDRRRVLQAIELVIVLFVFCLALQIGLPTITQWLSAKLPPVVSPISLALVRGNEQYEQARISQQGHDSVAAIAKFQEAMTSYERARSEKGKALCAYQIAICFQALYNDKTALSWMDKAINELHAADYAPSILTDAGYLSLRHDELNKAAYYLEKALACDHSMNPETREQVATTLRNIGISLLKQQHEQGLDAFIDAVKYETFNRRAKPSVYFHELAETGAYLEKQRNWTLANLVWSQAMQQCSKYHQDDNSDRITVLRAYERMAKEDSSLDKINDWKAEADRLEKEAKVAKNAGFLIRHQPNFEDQTQPPPAVPNPRRPVLPG